eukprot:4547034-Pleurochrysis_carterae.AAC.6
MGYPSRFLGGRYDGFHSHTRKRVDTYLKGHFTGCCRALHSTLLWLPADAGPRPSWRSGALVQCDAAASALQVAEQLRPRRGDLRATRQLAHDDGTLRSRLPTWRWRESVALRCEGPRAKIWTCAPKMLPEPELTMPKQQKKFTLQQQRMSNISLLQHPSRPSLRTLNYRSARLRGRRARVHVDRFIRQPDQPPADRLQLNCSCWDGLCSVRTSWRVTQDERSEIDTRLFAKGERAYYLPTYDAERRFALCGRARTVAEPACKRASALFSPCCLLYTSDAADDTPC